jgi:putative DNA primase/helicase
VPHNYDPKAKAPKWQAFLDRCLPEPEKRRTVQSFTGAGLLGDSLQRLMFHYGLGANGKSIFLETVTRVLGDSFAIGLPPESIVGGGDRNAGGASPDLARLFGKRMVRVLELPEGKALNEDLIKRLTGGERFPVRTLFKGYFEFENKAKPHMSGNAFPRVDGTDAGIWRRLLVVHWKQTIPVGERREFKDLLGDFLAEGPGILNWLIEGARDFLENGLYVAPEIESATDQWHAESDPIGEFFKDCVVDVPEAENATLTPSEAYAAYVAWSGYNAKHVKTQTKFGSEMVKRYRREQSNGRRYVNCGLRNVPTMASGDPGPSPEAYR